MSWRKHRVGLSSARPNKAAPVGKSVSGHGSGARDEKEESHNVIVIDNGSDCIKAGWAGQERPCVLMPNVALGGLSAPDSAKNTNDEFTVGTEAVQTIMSASSSGASAPRVITPWTRGDVGNSSASNNETDWAAIEQMWEQVLRKDLNVESPEEHSVLVTVSPTSSRQTHRRIAKIFFDSLKVKSLCIANQAVLSLFASGRATGISVDCGDQVTHAVPVFEGYALSHAIRRLDMGGMDVTQHLAKQLLDQGVALPKGYAQLQVAKHIKEKLCMVANPLEPVNPSADSTINYELPDGTLIPIEHKTRVGVPEILFEPSIANKDKSAVGLPRLVYDSMEQCDEYIIDTMYANIVLAGGTSMLPGFGNRVRQAVQELAGYHHILGVVQDSQRKYAAWTGGSMYASLPTYSMIEISRKEYVENENIVHKKYF